MKKSGLNTAQTLKYVSLLTLTVQNALLGLSMRHARTRQGDMFLSSTDYLTTEGSLPLLFLLSFFIFVSTYAFYTIPI